MNGNGSRSLNCSFGCQIGHFLKGGDILGTTVGVPAVIQRIDADEQVAGPQDLSPGERKRQENPVIQAIFEQFGGELVW